MKIWINNSINDKSKSSECLSGDLREVITPTDAILFFIICMSFIAAQPLVNDFLHLEKQMATRSPLGQIIFF